MTATATADAPTLTPCATAEFSLPGGRLFTFLLLRHCFWLLTSVVLVGLAMLCIGLAADLRLSIVALMVWCFCLPLTVALCWFRYALSPLNAFNQLPHTLRFTTDSIEVHVRPKAPDRMLTTRMTLRNPVSRKSTRSLWRRSSITRCRQL